MVGPVVLIVTALLIYPFLEDSRPGRAIFSVIGIAVLGLAVLAVRRTPSITWVSILFAAPALVLLAAQVFSQAAPAAPQTPQTQSASASKSACDSAQRACESHSGGGASLCRQSVM